MMTPLTMGNALIFLISPDSCTCPRYFSTQFSLKVSLTRMPPFHGLSSTRRQILYTEKTSFQDDRSELPQFFGATRHVRFSESLLLSNARAGFKRPDSWGGMINDPRFTANCERQCFRRWR
jgi:hypothetical protein